MNENSSRRILDAYRFSNGNFIFRNDAAILPTGPEGQKIEKILKLQKLNGKLNDEQKAFFEQLTHAKTANAAIELLIKGKTHANIVRPTPISNYKFSTGNYIFRKNTIIDPRSEEGEKIEKILEDQRAKKTLNKEQKEIVKQLSEYTTEQQAIQYLLKKSKQGLVTKGFSPNIPSLRKFVKKLPANQKAKVASEIQRSFGTVRAAQKNFTVTPRLQTRGAQETIPPKNHLAMRLTKVKINDLNSFFRKKASMSVVTLVNDGSLSQPVNVTLDSYDNIREGCELPMSQVLMYYNEKGEFPPYLDARILVIKSNESIRNLGEVLTKIKNDDQYKSAIDTLLSLLAGGTLTAVIKDQLTFILQIVGDILKTKKDDKLFYYPISLIKVFDGYNIQKCTNNDYVESCFSVQSVTI